MQPAKTNSLPPLHLRGRHPIAINASKPNTVVIRVRHQQHIRFEEWEGGWLAKAKPLTEHRATAKAYLEGDIDVETTSVRFVPARPQSLRLMWRAAREYVDGNYLRASQLVCRAGDTLRFEQSQGCWDGDGRWRIFDVYNGLRAALFHTADEAPVVAKWEQQADWWTGGEWPGSGMYGRMFDRLAESMKRITREERETARARKTARAKARAHR